MRKPHSDEALCVNCGKVINIIDSINVVDDAVAEGPSRAPTEVEQSTSNVEDPSQALADKMLEGWTLLAEHCPRCATPLVRSRQGRMLCVSCQMDVVAQPRGPGDGCRRPQETEDNAVQEQVIDSQIAQPGEDGLMEGDVRQDGGLPGAVMTTEEAILVRMSSTAQGLHGASAVDAAQKLEEISRCIQVLQELKNLALRP